MGESALRGDSSNQEIVERRRSWRPRSRSSSCRQQSRDSRKRLRQPEGAEEVVPQQSRDSRKSESVAPEILPLLQRSNQEIVESSRN